IFPCKALIITDATQELLIGTNWLAKFRTNIDLATNTLTIEGRNNLLQLLITCTKIIPQIQERQYESRCFNIYNTKECILEPRETKLIAVKKNNIINNMPYNSIYYIKSDDKKDFVLPNGIADSNSDIENIIVTNIQKHQIKIQKNEIVGNVEILENGIICETKKYKY
ncbi:hypothetical protein COBT_004070, partial [Conglomerata obtusa]